MMAKAKELIKIVFILEAEAWHGYATETVWAEEIGGGRYRLRNAPFYAFGVSAEDVVFTKSDSEGRLIFAGVSLHGGHSTYRIIWLQPHDEVTFRNFWEPLEVLGCTYEQAYDYLLAVDVPPKADIYNVYQLLERGEAAGIWHFEEGHCGHTLRE